MSFIYVKGVLNLRVSFLRGFTELATLFKTKKKSLVVKSESTHKQAGSDDCGLFAAAYSTSLAHGQNPSAFVYNQ